ncbi:hypothetical protein ACFL6O_04495 [candidate division KSB1 bacterium]
MNTKLIGQFALAVIIIVAVTLVVSLLFTPEFRYRDVETVEDYVQYREAGVQNSKFEHISTVLFTVSLFFFFISLYQFCKIKNPEWAAMGVFFLPPFAVIMLLLNAMQMSVMPQLISMYHQPEYQQAISMLFSQFLPGTENQAASIGNVVLIFLGIPALIFGLLLSQEQKLLKVTGILIAVSGIGFLGEYFSFSFTFPGWFSTILAFASFIGLLISLILLSIIFLRKKSREEIESSLNPH